MSDDSDKRTQARAPIQTKVNLEFEKFSGFISEFSTNISEGGMFVKTDDPKPVGTVLSFEFKLRDDFKLIQGWGDVAWIRGQTAGPNEPRGMGIRFHELDSKSKELIRTIVEQQVRHGRKPFEIGPPNALPISEPTLPTVGETDAPDDKLQTDFHALFDSEEDSPLQMPETPNVLEVTKPKFEDMGIVMEEQKATNPSAALTDLLEPEKKAPIKPRPKTKSSVKFAMFGVLAAGGVGAVLYFYPHQVASTLKSTFKTLFTRKQSAPPVSYQENFTTKGGVPQEMATSAPPTEPSPPVQAQTSPATETPAPATAITPSGTIPAPGAVQTSPAAIPTSGGPLATHTAQPTPTKVTTQIPEPTAPKASPVHSATTIQKIETLTVRGQTIISITANGELNKARISHVRMEGKTPREVVQIKGINAAYPKTKIPVGSSKIRQIRAGFHPEAPGSQLHVVIELASSKVKLEKVETKGSVLRLFLR